jgi:hypothetical protein
MVFDSETVSSVTQRKQSKCWKNQSLFSRCACWWFCSTCEIKQETKGQPLAKHTRMDLNKRIPEENWVAGDLNSGHDDFRSPNGSFVCACRCMSMIKFHENFPFGRISWQSRRPRPLCGHLALIVIVAFLNSMLSGSLAYLFAWAMSSMFRASKMFPWLMFHDWWFIWNNREHIVPPFGPNHHLQLDEIPNQKRA